MVTPHCDGGCDGDGSSTATEINNNSSNARIVTNVNNTNKDWTARPAPKRAGVVAGRASTPRSGLGPPIIEPAAAGCAVDRPAIKTTNYTGRYRLRSGPTSGQHDKYAFWYVAVAVVAGQLISKPAARGMMVEMVKDSGINNNRLNC